MAHTALSEVPRTGDSTGLNDDIRPATYPSGPLSPTDEKADLEMHENEFSKEVAPDVIMKSPFEDLSWRKTWVVFKKAAFMCLFASFSAAAE